MKATNGLIGYNDFSPIKLHMVEKEARGVRTAIILGLRVMKQQLDDKSPDFNAFDYINAEKAAAELAEMFSPHTE